MTTVLTDSNVLGSGNTLAGIKEKFNALSAEVAVLALALEAVTEDVADISTVTVQAANPTSASDPGWYLATTSGDLFYKSEDGLFTIAGSYAADA